MKTIISLNTFRVVLIKSMWLISFFFLICFIHSCCDIKNPGKCTSVQLLERSADSLPIEIFEGKYKCNSPFMCNQIILDASSNNADTMRNYLRGLCYKPIDTCKCGHQFELWEYPSVDAIADAQSVVQNAPRPGPIGRGLILNFTFDFSEPSPIITHTNKDSFNYTIGCPLIDSIKIAIVDSGVDPPTNNSYSSTVSGRINDSQFNWTAYKNFPTCCSDLFPRGIRLDGTFPLREPDDLNGHGTSVNAVSTGASFPNILINSPFKFVNIAILPSQGSGNLFDALCGLYYAIEQKPDIINISWGFKYLKGASVNNQLDIALHNVFLDCFNKANLDSILIVAGIGNDSLDINDYQKFYPASLAKNLSNVISVGGLNTTFNDLMQMSNYASDNSNYLTVCVPGENIITLYPAGLNNNTSGWAQQSGTSFATPLISRIAGIIKSKYNTTGPAQIKNKILHLSITSQSTYRSKLVDTTSKIKFREIKLDSITKYLCKKSIKVH